MIFSKKLLSIIITITMIASCVGIDVVEEPIIPEKVVISSAFMSIGVGDSVIFQADYFNMRGEREEIDIIWISINDNIISIDNTGLAIAKEEGETQIIAAVAGASNLADTVQILAGAQTIIEVSRMATFQGKNNYTVEGDGFLEQIGENVSLRFGENFNASNGPGLHVYLSNSSNSVTGGIDLGEIKSHNGAQLYKVPDNIGINSYNFIIIYCQPFNVPFGFGELK